MYMSHFLGKHKITTQRTKEIKFPDMCRRIEFIKKRPFPFYFPSFYFRETDMGGGRPKFNSLTLALAGDKSRERSEERGREGLPV